MKITVFVLRPKLKLFNGEIMSYTSDINRKLIGTKMHKCCSFACIYGLLLFGGRLSDGIKELNVGEADTLLIAGMGGGLIQKILSGNPEVLEQIQELVLQPQSEIMEVRRFVEGIGFTLVDENMVIDEGKYYVVLKAKRVVPQETYNNEVYYRYGKFLLEKKHLCMFSFLKQEEKKNLAIIESLEKHPSDRNEKTKEKIRKDNTYCREGLGYYDM